MYRLSSIVHLCLICMLLLELANSSRVFAQKRAQQQPAYAVISEVVLKGNQRTKPHIILRELDLQKGDTLYYEVGDSVLERNRNNVFNTNLFITVRLYLESPMPPKAKLIVEMQERWYLFPFPLFELSDRNFNEWWNTYNADLSRTNYGLRFVQENFRGRNEKLDFLLQFGFTQAYSISYKVPYIDRAMRYGLKFKVSFKQNKSIAYATEDHQLQFAESTTRSNLREYLDVQLDLNRRDGFYKFHKLLLGYKRLWVADTIVKLNPRFFLNGSQQQYLRLSYEFLYDDRDIAIYPLQGEAISLGIERRGLGIFNDLSQTRLSLGYAKYFPLSRSLYFDTQASALFSLQPEQPYSAAQALGYGNNFLRGYELYVIDGQGFITSKNNLKLRLFEAEPQLRFIPIPQFRTVPIACFLTAYLDAGFVHDRFFTQESQRFSNRPIIGGGLGLDVITFYNLVFKLNYSVNSDLETGFYINFSTGI